ncbi:hypothetical protein CMI48_01820 [Candidatus Pacearchaeota archaeon]|nr:hypothetical protein [Candidatus Pacearchaeota archaeon]|tara:strand:- start:203 stop:487 length:285 start_codon:yes stop_codon:yes gene_type:complete
MASDLTCAACEGIISGGYVIVGRAGSRSDSGEVVLHAESLREEAEEVAVTLKAMEDPGSCIGRYIHEDDRRNLYHPEVVHFDRVGVGQGTERVV